MAMPPTEPTFDPSRYPDAPGLRGLWGQLQPFFREVVANLSGGLTLEKNLASVVRRDVVVTIPLDWKPLTLTAGTGSWAASTDVSFEQPQYRQVENGDFEVTGLVRYTGSAGLAVGATVYTLSERDAPTGHRMYAAGGFVFSQVRMRSTGALTWELGESTFLSLAGISWTPRDRTPRPWGAPFPLDVATGAMRAAHVFVVADLIDAGAGTLQSVMPEWKPATVAGQRGFRITRLPGLTPGRKYRLTITALAEPP